MTTLRDEINRLRSVHEHGEEMHPQEISNEFPRAIAVIEGLEQRLEILTKGLLAADKELTDYTREMHIRNRTPGHWPIKAITDALTAINLDVVEDFRLDGESQ